jgi:tetratricopeptide (TPR) repeat protein
MTLGFFLLKRNEMDSLERLLACCPSPFPSPRRHLLQGYCALGHEEYTRALSHFKNAMESMPDNKRAIGAAARTALLASDYELDEQCYRRLSELTPENKGNQLNLSIAMIKNGKAAEATPLLYKLSYETPDDDNVRRALAWDLLACQKTPQAIKEYERLTNNERAKAEDHLNMGYCQWVDGHLDAALSYFKRFLQQKKGATPEQLKEEFEKDSDILQANGITPFEMNMMADMIALS